LLFGVTVCDEVFVSLERVTVVQQRETALDIARRKDNDELIALLTNVKV